MEEGSCSRMLEAALLYDKILAFESDNLHGGFRQGSMFLGNCWLKSA